MRHKFLILLVTGCLGLITATAQNIYTKAGTGNPGDYQPAATSQLQYPSDVAVDANGNIYITDGYRVRKINAADGKISTVAGNGSMGSGGDGGLATAAQLSAGGVAVDSKGNIFIADGAADCIRKVNAADGKISTVAGSRIRGYAGDGGLATACQLYLPRDVAVDGAGNLYIADMYNSRVRKVNAADGKISTVAGNGTWGYSGDGGAATAAQLSLVFSVAVDTDGNLYISDNANYCIRKVNAADGKISTLTGNPTLGYPFFSGEGGLATAASIGEPWGLNVDAAGNVYFADVNNDSYSFTIRTIRKTDGTIHTVAGSGNGIAFAGDGGPALSAKLYQATSVAVDRTGNLFITDAGNARLRKVNALDQVISTVAGTGTNNTVGPRAPVGDLGPATLARFNNPTGMVVDRDGTMYVLDNGNNCLRKLSVDGVITTVAGNGSRGFSGDGGPASAARFSIGSSTPASGGIAIDKAGNIYITDQENNRIRRINKADGIINTVVGNGVYGDDGDGGPALAASINCYPTAIALDSKGNIYIATGNNRIRKVNIADGTINAVVGTGDYYWDETDKGDGGVALSAKLGGVTCMAFDASDNLYIGDGVSVRKVNATTNIITTIAGNGVPGSSGDNGPATAASLNTPKGLVIDVNGNLFIADYDMYYSGTDYKNHIIRKINLASGIITTVAGVSRGFSGDGGLATAAKLQNPTGLAMDANGILYIADQGNNRIRYICTSSGLAATAMKDTRAAYPEDTTTTVNFNNNCTLICNLSPDGTQPVAGIMTGKVWIENNILLSNDRPYIQRHYEIAPELNAAAATGKVNLYFTQAEFDAYNAGAKVVDGVYLPLPVNAADAVNKQNLRIVYAKGVSSNNSGLLNTYGDTTVIIPAVVEWDAANSWWKVSFAAEGLGGFFVTSLKVPVPAADNLFVPNMFSPNADGKNDFLLVYGNHLNTVRLLIFNQWGQKIFETRNGNTNGWDGTAGGKPQPIGVYIYALEAKLDDGTVLKKKGSISLIR
jgi:gliding motility-associated-like protein